jgi:hypothetical protein
MEKKKMKKAKVQLLKELLRKQMRAIPNMKENLKKSMEDITIRTNIVPVDPSLRKFRSNKKILNSNWKPKVWIAIILCRSL